MICDECKTHILRRIGLKEGRTLNCFALGCDKFYKTGRFCDRDDIFDYCYELFEKKELQK